MLTHFQCDKCHFRNIQGRDPYALLENYTRLLVTIIRAALDAYRSREPVTFKVQLTMVKRLEKVVG